MLRPRLRNALFQGAVLTAVTIGTVSYLITQLPSSTLYDQVFSAIVLFAGWSWIVRVAVRGDNAESECQRQSTNFNANTLAQTTRNAITGVAGQIQNELTTAKSDLQRVQNLVGEAIGGLIGNFNGLAAQARSQQQLCVALTPRVRDKGGSDDATPVSFKDFADQTSHTLSCFVDHSVQTSKAAMGLVYDMDNIRARVTDVVGILVEIQNISKQTNLLALNAAIEAARAGDAGRGFVTVADEVRQLSDRTNQFSRQIGSYMNAVDGSIRRAEESINAMAAFDMNFALRSRQRVQEMMVEIERRNARTGEVMDQISHIASSVERDVASAVTSLQFQDITTQLIGYTNNRIDLLQEIAGGCVRIAQRLDDSGSVLEPTTAVARLHQVVGELNAFSQQIKEDPLRSPVAQSSMGSGDVELF
ncbi:MAG: methyl-accepting chemotaxis protein [Candidatus Binatia bacterium]